MSVGTDAAVSLSNVHKSFDRTEVVSDVSFDVRRGEFLILLGPSGSGKTTILRMIAGFERASSGTIQIAHQDVVGIPANRREVGFVFQQLALFPHLTVEHNVAFGLEARRVDRRERARRVSEALEKVRLGGLADRMPSQLSGGQQQRVALARALVLRPSVLLLDEPLGSLDKNLRLEMQVEIRSLQQTLGLTAVMVTHDQDEAMTMGDRVAVLRDGRLEQIGTPADVYRAPANRFIASFIGEANLFPVRRIGREGEGTSVEIAEGVRVIAADRLAGDARAERWVMIRPEHLGVACVPTGDRNCLRCSVERVVFAGALIRVWVRVSDEVSLACSLPAVATGQGAGFGVGSTAFVHWSPSATRILPG